jgi:hypothetical protein
MLHYVAMLSASQLDRDGARGAASARQRFVQKRGIGLNSVSVFQPIRFLRRRRTALKKSDSALHAQGSQRSETLYV